MKSRKDTIVVNVNHKKSVINKHIYGHFSEHLGRCIYGGFWVGEDSPIENIHGYRKDVVEAFKEIRIPNLRWPGGCFADEYHWKDGIGPKENRKRMVNTHWGGVVEDNSFGTHEFMGLCELLECEPYICGNVGSGTVQEMSEWVEYITFEGESPMSKLREANGHKAAWKLPFFGVGNENWGCGGNMTAEHYADLYRNYQTYVRQYTDQPIYKIAGGANVADYHWTEVLMQQAGKMMNGLSLHHYTFELNWGNKGSATEFTEKQWYTCLKNAFYMDELITRHDQIMSKYDPEKKVGFVVDEWGTWHKVEPDTNPGFLYQQNSVRDALVAAITLNIFNNHADRVQMANLAQAVNVLQSPVLTEGDKLVKTPTWHVLNMYKYHQNATLLETACTAVSTGMDDVTLPTMNVSASLDAEGTCTVTFCNTDLEEASEITIELRGYKTADDGNGTSGVLTVVDAQILAGEEMTSCNTFDDPEAVVAKPLAVTVDGNTLHCVLPPRSVAVIRVK